jgi:pimeloyl-ACP methyl ester carboxylesterase
LDVAATSNQIRLDDGRALAYTEYGDPKGRSILYFHGSPSSRLEAGLLEPTAMSLNVRVIAPDRPGFGGSEFKPGRKLEDWPEDVIELADALELDRFAILGVSGGGPYVAVCALKIPQRLSAAGIVSGLGPADAPGVVDSMRRQNRQLLQLGRRAPWLVRILFWLTARAMKRDPDRVFDKMAAELPEADQAVLARVEYRKYLRATVLEAFRPGTRGAALETALYAKPWGFRLQDIKKEVHLWQGELDINVTPAMGRYLATAIPNCHARFYEDEGHLSLLPNRMQEIIGILSST